MTEETARKIVGLVPVTAELLADGGFLVPELFRPSSPSRHAAEKARRKAARDESRAKANERHAVARAKVNPALVSVLDHHGPVVPQLYGYGTVECEGCDAGLNEEASAEWPCSTWCLITGQSESRVVEAVGEAP